MIRKLKNGEYRLYSRKRNPETVSGVIWELSVPLMLPNGTSAKCNISKGTNLVGSPLLTKKMFEKIEAG